MALEDIKESKKLVRLYSFDVEERLPPGSEAHLLGQILSDDNGTPEDLTAPWRKFFDSHKPSDGEEDPITSLIAVESDRLRTKWLAFQKSCPKEERVNLHGSEPSVEGVTDMVTNMLKASRAKRDKSHRGRALSLFQRFCSCLDSHSNMLLVLPQGNEYVSIFTGSLTAIIKASVNHERLAEELSEALCEISCHIVDCQTELELFRTTPMLKKVADLYGHMFLFLSSTMDWMMEKRHKRILDSFNENFNKKFEDEINAIKQKMESIQSLAAQSARGELRVTRLTVDEMRQDIRLGLEGDARDRAERKYFEEQVERELLEAQRDREMTRVACRQLVIHLKRMLEQDALSSLQAKSAIFKPLQLMGFSDELSELEDRSKSGGAGNKSKVWDSAEVILNSRNLEDFFHRDRVRLSDTRQRSLMINTQTILRLSEWTESTKPQMLWLEGPALGADDHQSPVTAIASKFIELADASKVPIISYFCEIPRRENLRSGNTQEVQAMLALVYGIIRQIIELLLPRFNTGADFAERRFENLNGTLESWSDALDVLQDLLGLMPTTVFVVLDGLHWLDDGSTIEPLQELFGTLRRGQLRVLLTTTGRSACLVNEISSAETLRLDRTQLRRGETSMDRSELWSPP
ncbi:hypothetical protein EJ08DRAFT_648471 [Tothia fuscella]|uniref:DUF7708 domain-containing protein n=1 Tax=Tothia fuscella TaxID=1048955 RepID=A0A9P4TZ51_9PEZI|nr:hypothetical protein EJ08DRAFT_648471 [Tothia fuscella]